MFSDLPEHLQNEVLRYLETNNFKIAKQLHDNWMDQQKDNKNQVVRFKKKELNSLIWVSIIASSVGAFYVYIPYLVMF